MAPKSVPKRAIFRQPAPRRRRGAPSTVGIASSKGAPPSDFEVVVWHDPEWEPALHALEGYSTDGAYTGKADPEPLAKLLRSGKTVPIHVTQRLGVLLAPLDTKANQLQMKISKRYSGQGELKRIREMFRLKALIEAALKPSERKLEAAIAEVMAQTGLSRSHLMKAWKFSIEQGIVLLAKYNPLPPKP